LTGYNGVAAWRRFLKPGEKVYHHDIEKMIELEKPAHPVDDISIPTLAESERNSIEKALIKCRGVIGGKNGAARLLDVPRSTLQYRMKKHNITPTRSIQI
jgi:transcriptional regulator with GAF, ATPase, and Fis domain